MRNRGDEPVQVIKYIYMEVSQWNTLYSYLKKQKSHLKENIEKKGKTDPVW
jgi:hypothetical protein